MNYPSFVNGTYQTQAVTGDQERTVNWIYERMESEGATSRSALYPTPGVQKVCAHTTTGGRAHIFVADREFAVIGGDFIEISNYGVITEHGEVTTGSDPATISSNGDGGGQLLITSGDNGYVFDLATNVLSAVAFLAGKATMGDSLDGYFLVLDSNTSTFYISDLLDGLTWDPTMFAQRTIAPDPWISMIVNGRYVWLLGTETSEVWYDAGQGNFPFAPHPSGLIQYGIASRFSAAILDGGILMWLGASRNGDGRVLRASGFTPEVVSDYPIQYAFDQYTTLSDALADTYTADGHTFYLLTFPTANATWTWDNDSGKWTERMTWIPEENRYVEWRPQWHAMAYGEHRMLDRETGAVYRMSNAFPNDVDERPTRRLRRAPCLFAENQPIFFSYFELFLDPGLGLPPFRKSLLPQLDESVGISLGLIPGVDFADPGSVPLTPIQGWQPMVMLRCSNDGGKTWSNEMWRSVGLSGQYLVRVRWDRLGRARRRVFEVSTSDPVPYRITGAAVGIGQPVRVSGAQQQAQAGA